jgi:uncharacterized protein YbjQ (UPF0145 family)
MNTRRLFTTLLVILLGSCTTIIRTDGASDKVRLYFISTVIDKDVLESLERSCTRLGEVIGSEGHWYTYLFISNTNLTQGALNDIKNRAHSMGANTVVIFKNIDFATSVTLLGQAYTCSKPPI